MRRTDLAASKLERLQIRRSVKSSEMNQKWPIFRDALCEGLKETCAAGQLGLEKKMAEEIGRVAGEMSASSVSQTRWAWPSLVRWIPTSTDHIIAVEKCLSVVKFQVAEFANVRKQLEVLEESLDEMVLPHLVDALTNHKIDAVQDLRSILVRIGRSKSLELQYTKILVKPLKKLWEDFDIRHRSNKLEMERHI